MTKEKLNSIEKPKKNTSFKKKIKKWKNFIIKCLKWKKWPTTQKEADRLKKNKIKKDKYDEVVLVPDYSVAIVTKEGKSKVVSKSNWWNPTRLTDLREEMNSEWEEWENKSPIIPADLREELNFKWEEWENENDWTDVIER